MSDFKCPYCDEGHSWDDGPHEEDTYDYECASCEKKFKVEVCFSVDYYSHGSCAMNEELPHKLQNRSFGTKNILYTCTKCKLEFYDWQMPGGAYPKLKEGDFFIDTQKTLEFPEL